METLWTSGCCNRRLPALVLVSNHQRVAVLCLSCTLHQIDTLTPDCTQDMKVVRDYIQYAKTAIHPRIAEDASQALIEEYVEMRKLGSGRGQVSGNEHTLTSVAVNRFSYFLQPCDKCALKAPTGSRFNWTLQRKLSDRSV